MTNEQAQKINEILFSFKEKVEELPSIELKLDKYLSSLDALQKVGVLPFEVDIKSEELIELITNNFLNIEIDEPKIFKCDGYVPWLEKERKNISWNYKNRYFKYLLNKKHWIPQSVFALDKMSDIILDHTANPKDKQLFDVRGLVMGDIQSGKTANYTALINKAIDAGYKIIIILAGITRELRNQTQNRLDAEVAGRITSGPKTGSKIGVGDFGHPNFNVETLTYADAEKDFGDFKKFFTHHVLDDNLNPLIAVVKKNTSILKHMYDFLTKSDVDCYDEEGKLRIPVMIIDDEVDQASVDTKAGTKIDDASAINKWIRKILNIMSKSAYVGYTATPFANVFIDPDKENDLYPKDFILYIQPSKGYCGIKEYFGVDIEEDDDDSTDHSTELFREIKQGEYLSLYGDQVRKIKVDTDSVRLPGSLKQAIMDYVLACSIKKARSINGYNSMLIHIDRHKNPSTTLKPLVESYVGELLQNINYNYDQEIKIYKERWESDFKSISQNRLGEKFNDSWDAIESYLVPTLESIKMDRIKVLNGDSADYLDYSSSDAGDYIVIGGDKLSRGLTLEGLCVSYYWRKTKNYDSLLQMGRWFGYRNGWIDVCRIYTSVKFMNDFITVGKVLEKFKKDLANMYNDRLNPREVGQRIMYSSNLLPTSRSKMRGVAKLKVSFSNEIQQIISFDRKLIPDNYQMTIGFIESLGEPSYLSDTGKLVYKDLPVEKVLEYLKKYKECGSFYEYGQINMQNWIKYIENLVPKGELTTWTIVISSVKSSSSNPIKVLGGQYQIFKRDRVLRDIGKPKDMDHYTVKVVTDPADFKEALDRGTEEYKSTSIYKKDEDYASFNETNGLLSIYVFDLHERRGTGEFDPKTNKEKTYREPKAVSDGINVCAPAIWFPKTKDYENSAVAYFVTKDYASKNPIEEESEDDD